MSGEKRPAPGELSDGQLDAASGGWNWQEPMELHYCPYCGHDHPVTLLSERDILTSDGVHRREIYECQSRGEFMVADGAYYAMDGTRLE